MSALKPSRVVRVGSLLNALVALCILGHLSSMTTHADASLVAGSGGYALLFDGVDDFVNMGPLLDISDAFTISYWVDVCTSADRQTHLSKVLTSTGTTLFEISFDNSRLSIFWATGSWSALPKYTGPHQYAFSVQPFNNGSTVRAYVDGVLAAETNTTTPINALPNAAAADMPWILAGRVRRIRQGALRERFLCGLFDEVRVFSTARTPAEIASDYRIVIGDEDLATAPYSTTLKAYGPLTIHMTDRPHCRWRVGGDRGDR
eukprot:Opistho-2@5596